MPLWFHKLGTLEFKDVICVVTWQTMSEQRSDLRPPDSEGIHFPLQSTCFLNLVSEITHFKHHPEGSHVQEGESWGAHLISYDYFLLLLTKKMTSQIDF